MTHAEGCKSFAGLVGGQGWHLHGVRGALLLGDNEGADLEAAVLLVKDPCQDAAALNSPPRVGGCIPAREAQPVMIASPDS